MNNIHKNQQQLLNTSHTNQITENCNHQKHTVGHITALDKKFNTYQTPDLQQLITNQPSVYILSKQCSDNTSTALPNNADNNTEQSDSSAHSSDTYIDETLSSDTATKNNKKTTRRRIKRYRLHKSTKRSNESIEGNA